MNTPISDAPSRESNLHAGNVSLTSNSNEGSVTTISATVTEISSGPLPHPDLLARYSNIIPNGAERIMAKAEKEQAARLENRSDRLKADNRNIGRQLAIQQTGQWMAFSIVMVILALATLFVFTGHETMAYVLYGSGMVSLAGLFLGVVKSSVKKNRKA